MRRSAPTSWPRSATRSATRSSAASGLGFPGGTRREQETGTVGGRRCRGRRRRGRGGQGGGEAGAPRSRRRGRRAIRRAAARGDRAGALRGRHAAARSGGRRFGEGLGRADKLRNRATKSDLAFLIARLSNFGPHASPSMVEYIVNLSLRSPVEVWTEGIAALIEMDLRHAIGHVRCPALVIVGDLDRLTPPASAIAIKDHLPDGRLVVLEDAGHMAPMERHDQFNEVLRGFLSDVFETARTRSW